MVILFSERDVNYSQEHISYLLSNNVSLW